MVPSLNKQVFNTSESVSVFNKKHISESVYSEINYVAKVFGMPRQITKKEAREIACRVERHITSMNGRLVLSGPLIREFVCGELDSKQRRLYTRVGMSIYDAIRIDNVDSDLTTENANQAPNAETKHKKKGDQVSREQALLALPPHLSFAHLNSDLHIHDLEYFTNRTFCMDWDLRFFFYYGLDPDCTGKTNIASAAKNPEVALLHAAKVLGSAQTNFAGGQGYYNFLTFISPYLEGLRYDEIKQLMQMFIFEISQTMVARGAQVVFSSIQLSPGVPKLWKDKPAVYRGQVWNGKKGVPFKPYKMFEREVRLAFKALMEVMYDGDTWGKPFNFPKPEVAIEKEFLIPHEEDVYFEERDKFAKQLEELKFPKYDVVKLKHKEDQVPPTYSELYSEVMKLAIKFGTPYFDNMLPRYRQTDGIQCYQCCAFSFSADSSTANFEEKLDFIDGQHFSMGANQVITLNVPRVAYKVEPGDFDALMAETKSLIDLAVEIQIFKKKWIKKLWYGGHIPFATQQLTHPKTREVSPPAVDYEELVYIIGILGMNEVAERFTGHPLEHPEGHAFMVKYCNRIKDYVKKKSTKHKIELVFSRTPAETTAQRFAVSDLISYPTIARKYIKGDLEAAESMMKDTKDLPIYYSNGTHLPVDTTCSISDRIDIEETYFPILQGGNIFHIWMGENDPDPEGLKEFIFGIIQETQIGYFAFTRDFSICGDCKQRSAGIKDDCPDCGSHNVEAYSRITGYIQAVSGWNEAKKQELRERTRITSLK